MIARFAAPQKPAVVLSAPSFLIWILPATPASGQMIPSPSRRTPGAKRFIPLPWARSQPSSSQRPSQRNWHRPGISRHAFKAGNLLITNIEIYVRLAHCPSGFAAVGPAGLANRTASIGTFHWTCSSWVVVISSGSDSAQRKGTFTPLTSR
jgi:hypothetical protein